MPGAGIGGGNSDKLSPTNTHYSLELFEHQKKFKKHYRQEQFKKSCLDTGLKLGVFLAFNPITIMAAAGFLSNKKSVACKAKTEQVIKTTVPMPEHK